MAQNSIIHPFPLKAFLKRVVNACSINVKIVSLSEVKRPIKRECEGQLVSHRDRRTDTETDRERKRQRETE